MKINNLKRIFLSLYIALTYPATLFSLGNTFLALFKAGPFGIYLNIILTIFVILAKFTENYTKHKVGVPFAVLGIINIITAFSIELKLFLGENSPLFFENLKNLNFQETLNILSSQNFSELFILQNNIWSAHVSAGAFIFWAIGHFLVSYHQRNNSIAQKISSNPQVFYGFSDIMAVHAAGIINWFALPFAFIGFLKSLNAKKTVNLKHKFFNKIYQKLTPAKLYGISYFVGAIFSISFPTFAIAQFFWGLAYLGFRKYA